MARCPRPLRMSSAAFSAIMIVGAAVCPPGILVGVRVRVRVGVRVRVRVGVGVGVRLWVRVRVRVRVLICPPGILGMADASTTRRARTPRTWFA